MKKHLRNIMVAGVSLLSLIANGCGSSSSTSPPTTRTAYLYGYVTAQNDISGASIKVLDKNGAVIAEQKGPATSDYGAFAIKVQNLPSAFRVVATGGTEAGNPVTYDLMAQVEDFNPANDIMYINMVTTMVCAHLDSNPGKGLSEATDEIKAFLSIPEDIDIQESLYHIDLYFSHSVFESTVQASGHDLDGFIGKLLVELSNDPTATHDYSQYRAAAGDAPASAAAPKILLNLPTVSSMALFVANGAATGTLGWGANYILNQATGGNDIAVMKNKLVEIQTQLTTLNQGVLASKNEILAAIADSNLQRAFDNVNNQEEGAKEIFAKLKMQILLNPITPEQIEDRRKATQDLIRRIGNEIIPKFWGFYGFLMNTNQFSNNGLFSLYATMIKTKFRFITKENYQDRVNALALYYNHIETMMFYLTSEYNRVNAPGNIQADADKLTANTTKEQTWLGSVRPLSGEVIIDIGQSPKLMIYEGSETYRFTRDEETKTGKAILRATWQGAEDAVADYNGSNRAGFSSWRKIRENELQNFYTTFIEGQVTAGQYLEGKGWVTQFGEVYVGTAPALRNETLRVCDWLCGQSGARWSDMRFVDFRVKEMRFPNYWHTIRENWWVSLRDYESHRETRPPSLWHWMIVRTIGADENYTDYR